MNVVTHRVEIPAALPWQEKANAVLADTEARFIAACMGRQAGKTTWVSTYSGRFSLGVPKRQTMYVAHTHDIASIALDRFMDMWRPALKDYQAGNRKALFWNGSSILWRSSDNPDSLIGRTNDLVIADEAARISEDALKRALIPTVMVRKGQIIAPSTPSGNRNWFSEWCRRAMSGDWPTYRMVSGPSTENTSPAVRAFVEEMRRDLPERLFRQEILAEFIDDAGAVFRNVRACATSMLTDPIEGHDYAVGCDLAKHTDYTVTVPIDLETGECGPLDRYHRIAWPQLIERIETERRRWNGAALAIDSTGVGDPVYDDLAARGIPIEGVKFTSDSKSHLVVGLATALEREEIRIPDDSGLISELESFAYETLPSGRYRYGAPEGMHDDRVIALALAVYGRTHFTSHRGLMSFYRDRAQEARVSA